MLAVALWVGILEELVLRAASVGEGRLHGSVFRWGGCMQLGPVAAEHEIAHIDAVGAGSCTVDYLPINLRVPPLRWLRFCRNRRSQWERHQQSLCMLVTLSFGCYLGAVKFRGDCGGMCNFRSKQLFREQYRGPGASAH